MWGGSAGGEPRRLLVLIFSAGKWFICKSISHSALNYQFLLIVCYWLIGVLLVLPPVWVRRVKSSPLCHHFADCEANSWVCTIYSEECRNRHTFTRLNTVQWAEAPKIVHFCTRFLRGCCFIQGFAPTQETTLRRTIKMTYRLEERSYFTAWG